jgi:hypothetical protein
MDTAELRAPGAAFGRVTVGAGGLSPEQIQAIAETPPPPGRPVDLALVFLEQGALQGTLEDSFAFAVVEALQASDDFDRITPLPAFIVPAQPSFDSLQELGVRSLSEYVLVFHLSSDDVFEWTRIVDTQWQLQSSISFLLLDSRTGAMLTADRLFSTQNYRDRLFETEESEKARRELLAAQAALLGRKLATLFSTE